MNYYKIYSSLRKWFISLADNFMPILTFYVIVYLVCPYIWRVESIENVIGPIPSENHIYVWWYNIACLNGLNLFNIRNSTWSILFRILLVLFCINAQENSYKSFVSVVTWIFASMFLYHGFVNNINGSMYDNRKNVDYFVTIFLFTAAGFLCFFIEDGTDALIKNTMITICILTGPQFMNTDVVRKAIRGRKDDIVKKKVVDCRILNGITIFMTIYIAEGFNDYTPICFLYIFTLTFYFHITSKSGSVYENLKWVYDFVVPGKLSYMLGYVLLVNSINFRLVNYTQIMWQSIYPSEVLVELLAMINSSIGKSCDLTIDFADEYDLIAGLFPSFARGVSVFCTKAAGFIEQAEPWTLSNSGEYKISKGDYAYKYILFTYISCLIIGFGELTRDYSLVLSGVIVTLVSYSIIAVDYTLMNKDYEDSVYCLVFPENCDTWTTQEGYVTNFLYIPLAFCSIMLLAYNVEDVEKEVTRKQGVNVKTMKKGVKIVKNTWVLKSFIVLVCIIWFIVLCSPEFDVTIESLITNTRRKCWIIRDVEKCYPQPEKSVQKLTKAIDKKAKFALVIMNYILAKFGDFFGPVADLLGGLGSFLSNILEMTIEVIMSAVSGVVPGLYTSLELPTVIMTFFEELELDIDSPFYNPYADKTVKVPMGSVNIASTFSTLLTVATAGLVSLHIISEHIPEIKVVIATTATVLMSGYIRNKAYATTILDTFADNDFNVTIEYHWIYEMFEYTLIIYCLLASNDAYGKPELKSFNEIFSNIKDEINTEPMKSYENITNGPNNFDEGKGLMEQYLLKEPGQNIKNSEGHMVLADNEETDEIKRYQESDRIDDEVITEINARFESGGNNDDESDSGDDDKSDYSDNEDSKNGDNNDEVVTFEVKRTAKKAVEYSVFNFMNDSVSFINGLSNKIGKGDIINPDKKFSDKTLSSTRTSAKKHTKELIAAYDVMVNEMDKWKESFYNKIENCKRDRENIILRNFREEIIGIIPQEIVEESKIARNTSVVAAHTRNELDKEFINSILKYKKHFSKSYKINNGEINEKHLKEIYSKLTKENRSTIKKLTGNRRRYIKIIVKLIISAKKTMIDERISKDYKKFKRENELHRINILFEISLRKSLWLSRITCSHIEYLLKDKDQSDEYDRKIREAKAKESEEGKTVLSENNTDYVCLKVDSKGNITGNTGIEMSTLEKLTLEKKSREDLNNIKHKYFSECKDYVGFGRDKKFNYSQVGDIPFINTERISVLLYDLDLYDPLTGSYKKGVPTAEEFVKRIKKIHRNNSIGY